MLAGHRITFRGPHPIKNKIMLGGLSWPAGHVLPTPGLIYEKHIILLTLKIII